MHVLVVAFMLYAALVDPRLDEPLQLLAEVHDAAGEPIGEPYARMPDDLGLTLIVASLPPRAGAYYQPHRRVLTVADVVMSEDPRVVAAGLVHELQHASDFDLIDAGMLGRDCVELEARAFAIQARVTRAFWPDDLPGGSVWEQGLARTVMAYEAGGMDGLRAMVRQDSGYRMECQGRA